MTVDALPGEVFTARVGALSGLAARANWSATPPASAGCSTSPSSSSKPDPRLKAGSSVRLVIEGKELADALHVPRQAVFERDGKNHVFVKVGDRFEERDVKVTQRTESRVVVEGLSEGTRDRADRSDRAPGGGHISLRAPTVPAAGAPR